MPAALPPILATLSGSLYQITSAPSASQVLGINSGGTAWQMTTLAASATTDTTNASNISSGTLANARLPSAISVSSLTSSGATTVSGVFTGSGGGALSGGYWTIANNEGSGNFRLGGVHLIPGIYLAGAQDFAVAGQYGQKMYFGADQNGLSNSAITAYQGKVGIATGTTAPTVALDVVGDVKATGTVKLGTYTVATLPTPGTAARTAYASNARNSGEGAGAGTGSLVIDNGTNWRIPGVSTAVTA